MYKKIYRNMCFLSMLTLVLSAIMILSASYTTFENRIQSEMESKVLLIAGFLNSSDNAFDAAQKAEIDTQTMHMTVLSPAGSVIYDNGFSMSPVTKDLPEIKQAYQTGEGSLKKYSVTQVKNMYSFARRLDGGGVLYVATLSDNIFAMLLAVILCVGVIAVLIYVLSVIIAMRLTDNIIKPIETAYAAEGDVDYDSVYDEIKPFLKRIERQNKEIIRQMEKTKTQKVRLQAIADNINEGLVILDSDANILSVNNCAMDIFSPREESIKYKSFQFLSDNAELGSAIERAVAGEKSNITVELSSKIYQIFYSPVYEHGKINGVVLLLFDVSEKAKAEQIRREFSANVSHELKTPLTTIHGYAQLIKGKIARPEDVDGFLEKIEKESLRLVTLIDDIIKLSRLDENRGSAEKEHFSLSNIVSEVLETLHEKAAEKGISLSGRCDDFEIYANASQITELVYNLCDNAIKYNKPGGSVEVTAKNGVLCVKDTGIGIEQEYTDRIFERFFRVDKSHSKKINGTGLGLSIVKHIAQINGAAVHVSSVLGEGSCFTVDFQNIKEQ